MADTLVIFRDDKDSTGLDISDYVDVDRGGIDPGDGPAREPVFTGGAQGYGQLLSHVQVNNRVFQAALLLSASSTDALGGLAQRIETILGGRRAWIQWTREGASAATWYRVRFGRLVGDNRYDQKMEAQTFHGRRQLVAQVEPYGIGGRTRYSDVVASSFPVLHGPTGAQWGAMGSYAVATRNFASLFTEANPAVGIVPSIGGDGPRMLRVIVSATSPSEPLVAGIGSFVNLSQVFLGFSRSGRSPVLSAASAGTALGNNWTPLYRLGHQSTAYGPTSWGTDPWSPGGGYYVPCKGTRLASGLIPMMTEPFLFAQPRPTLSFTADDAALYRVFACIRTRQHTTAGSSVPGRVQFEFNGVRGPIATLALRSPSQWCWYDVGEVAAPYFDGAKMTGVGFEQPTGFTGLASFNFEVAAIAGIPADLGFCRINAGESIDSNQQIAVLSDSDGPYTAAGKVFPQGLILGYWDESFPRVAWAGDVSGELPVLPPQGSPAASPIYITALGLRGNGQAGIAATMTHHGQERIVVGIAAYDRYTWAK